MTSSRGRSLALGNEEEVGLATAKRLPSAKDSLLTLDARISMAFSDVHMLLSIDSYEADASSETIVNQKQHHSSRPGGPAAPIQTGSESASTYLVEQQAPTAKPYIALLL